MGTRSGDLDPAVVPFLAGRLSMRATPSNECSASPLLWEEHLRDCAAGW